MATTEPLERRACWLIPAAYAAVHLALAPRTYNIHAIMYALVTEVGGSNTLEIFHPLYVPLLTLIRNLRVSLGFAGRALFAYQLLSLSGAAAHLWILHRLARRVLGNARLALLSAILATGSLNLWAWSMQTMPYTWATTSMLAVVLLLLSEPELTPASAAGLGALTGVAVGFDTACLALVPAVLVEIGWTGKGRSRRIMAGLSYLGVCAAVSLLAYGPLLLMGRLQLPSNLPGFIALPPFEAMTLYDSRSLFTQMRLWRESSAPTDVPWLLLAALCGASLWAAYRTTALPEIQRRFARIGAVLFSGISIFFLINDPDNRFFYAAGLLCPILLVLWLTARSWSSRLALAAWAALLARNALRPADYLPKSNPGFDESRFLSGKLNRKDLLVAVSQPDWLFSYAFEETAPVIRPAWPEEEAPHDAPPAYAPGPRLNARIDAVLCAGGKAFLASDSLFRDELIPPQVMDSHIGTLLGSISGKFTLAEAVVSPSGQHYYPFALKSSAACRPHEPQE